MRNLAVARSSECQLWQKEKNVERLHISISSDCPNLLFACHDLKIVQYDSSGSATELLDIREQIPTYEDEQVLDIFFLAFQRTLCLALTSGEVILVNIDTREIIFPDVESFLQQGLKAIALSPDQELIATVTTDDKLFLFNSMFDIINETYIMSSEFGEGEFITVGWGKKETQFHGSEGKQAAHKKADFNIDVGVDEDCRTVSWRGDGAYFVVGFVANSQAYFKVYNREGILQYTSEKQSGLECKFSWRPSGNLIATTQVFPNKYVIAFFEKNGLKHGELVLPFKREDVTVKNISWSGDSEVLCVWCVNNSTKDDSILIYTVNNYHWYLKQSLRSSSQSRILAMKWEEPLASDLGKCLDVITTTGIHMKIDWIWSTDQSCGKNENDGAFVGVIDGSKVLITGFKYSVVPPPMSSYTLECESNVSKLLFGPISDEDDVINSNSICVFMEDGSCSIHAFTADRKFKNVGFARSDFIKNLQIINNMVWLTKHHIVWVESDGEISTLHTINITYESELCVKLDDKIEVNENIVGIRRTSNRPEIILQTSTGKLLSYKLHEKITDFDISLPECCHEFDVIVINDDYMVFGLSSRNRFYINDTRIANNITSYYVHSDFLLFTTLQHQLLSCPLTQEEIRNLQKNQWCNKTVQTEQNENEFMSRRIERGAYLVTAVSCDSRTVLQMPRGNIEVVQPRALSLKIIGDYLDRKEYNLAFDLMRRQRINLNIVYDHNAELFLENIPIFIGKIDNSNWLSLFISDLDEQDVRKTMYSGAYKDNLKNAPVDGRGKVRYVCEKIRECLETMNENNKYLLPILTTHVKLNTVRDLENALLKIKQVKDNDEDGNVVNANDALKYLLYMVNVEELYNIALGLYDFDLVMFVANKSQKDPKEYVPYVNRLKTMDGDYRRFSIDNDLKRYESALKHLIKYNKDDAELLSFIKQHCLYAKALNQIEKSDKRYTSVAEEFGNFLSGKRHHTEAAMMYLRSGTNEKALECFVEALEYQSAINLAHSLKYSDDSLDMLQRKLVNKLKEVGRYREIVSLLKDSNSADVEEIITYALNGKLFKTALNICNKHERSDLIDKTLKPAILEQQDTLLNTINQNRTQFEQQKDRLLIVRENKAKKLTAEGADENLHPDCDLYSDTSSIMGSTSSRSSGKSHRSSKNRRKHERKMVSLKEGSRFEDIALVRALHTLVTTTFNLRQDVAEMCFVLRWFSYDDQIKSIQEALDRTLVYMMGNFDIIWIPELNIEANKSLATELKNQDITTITDASFSLEPHIRIPPVIQEIKWKMEYL